MKLQSSFLVFIATLWTAIAVGQVQTTPTGSVPSSSSSPAAYVYVSSSPSSGKNQINAYSSASTGKLTTVAGSPFSADVAYMAVNGKYLFGSNGVSIYSFSISSTGALAQVASINGQQFNQPPTTGGPENVVLDHTGTSLYAGDIYAIDMLGARAAGITGKLIDQHGMYHWIEHPKIRHVGELHPID